MAYIKEMKGSHITYIRTFHAHKKKILFMYRFGEALFYYFEKYMRQRKNRGIT